MTTNKSDPSPAEVVPGAPWGPGPTPAQRVANLRAHLAVATDQERRLALTVALALKVARQNRGAVGTPVDLHALCPSYYGPGVRWGGWSADPRDLIKYEPQPIAGWFAREAAAQGLPFDGTFKWAHRTWWGRTKSFTQRGWMVGSSTLARGGFPPCSAWVFPDGSYALAEVPEPPGLPLGNFSPECLLHMVVLLGLDKSLPDDEERLGTDDAPSLSHR